MKAARNDHALSEVIGFILLLVVIITAFSLYLTYAVPAQGRENEIKHMGEVNDELTGYKIGVDALWTNGKVESLMSTTIHMGTPGATQGGGGFLPIVQPIGSSGTVAINQRTPSPEWLTISSYSYVTNQTYKINGTPTNITSTKIYQSYPNPPDNLLINISGLTNIGIRLIPNTLPLTPNSSRSINITGTDNSGTVWLAQVNLTQRITLYQYYFTVMNKDEAHCLADYNLNGTPIWVNNGGSGDRTCFVPANRYSYTATDLTLTVFKNTSRTMSDTILYRDISASGTSYVIDLLDPIYGLSSNIRATSTISYNKYDPTNSIAANATGMYAYNLMPNYNYTIPLGAIEYRSHNNYWIPQTYYYQMGGVFLNQSDGVSSKVPPPFTFSYNATGAIAVNIIAIGIDPANTGVIGGTNPVQIGTKIQSNSGDLPYAPITNNTMNVTVNFTSPTNDLNTILMWKQVFKDAANRTGGIPGDGIKGNPPYLYYVGNTTSGTTIVGSYLVVRGVYDPDTTPGVNANTPDITLRVKAVNLTASIQNMGGV